MMVQNAAFVPDAIPAAAAQTGMAAAAAAPGGGVFQQLLQGKQTQGKPAEKQAAAAERPAPEKTPKAPSRPAKAEEKPQPTQQEVNGSARDGLPAKAAQTPALQKAVVAGGKFQAHQATRKKEAAEEPGAAAPAQASGTETVSAAPSQNDAAAPEAVVAAPETTPEDQAQTAATGTVQATGMRPDPNPGLVVAMAALESSMAARSVDGNAEAGATALARLQAVQQRMQQPATPESAADADSLQPEQQQQAVNQQNQQNQQNQPTGNAAGVKLSQKAEPATLIPQDRGAQVVHSTGATEGAQVEKPQAAVAPAASAENRAQTSQTLPDAAKNAVAADQAVAASHLTAKQTGEGRFVAMPVRNLSANAGEPAEAVEPATTGAALPQESAQAQQDVAENTMQNSATVSTTGAGTQGAEAEQATLQSTAKLQEEQGAAKLNEEQGTAKLHEEQGTVKLHQDEQGTAKLPVEQGTAKQEEQAEPVQVSKEEAAQAAETAPQRREPRQGEAVTGTEVREAEQARQGNLARPSGDDVSGTRSASTATAKLVSEPGAVREMSGAQGEQGQSQQKGQEQNGQALGLGVPAQGNAEVAQADTKQAGSKSLLHESVLSQVREGVVTHDGKGNGQMSIRLNPGELGELKIQLRMENNRLNVEVHADNHMVKDLLMSNLDTLKEALSGKNFTMDGFNVSTGGGGFNGPLNEEKGNQRQQQAPRFARGTGYDGQEAPRVNYLTAEVNNLLDVRF